ncbi:unnamed protein product [Kluyveromyces dobzhanskii CBS 2104]|uniref:WGS project CCBQ000000000 data, contig 00014 n=1 Tax=Kluyveromyces dobzhanskii CBS 2104 TaxID=1427455 RepID=A0A0A8L6F2_9SACH|nr:unnamed protein product [Kluyveromyces dobzhanskii CBS 2104]
MTSAMEWVLFVPWFVKRVYIGGTNQRNVFTLALNFCLNFSPIFVWLCMFKNAGVIPTSWRPRIWGNVAYYCDVFIFGDYFHSLTSDFRFILSIVSSSVIGVVFAIVPLFVWYFLYYTKKMRHNLFDETDILLQCPLNHAGSSQFKPSRMRNIFPFLFPFFTFVMLNFDHLLSSQDPANFTKFKDLSAWVMYVILHLTGPILTGVYLYVFHAPGTLKCFSFALGLQNIAGLCTHILLPMAPPWFIHMYGANDTAHLNYEQPGYAAGLTRVDMHLGTHLNSNGFHLSPIVFGAVPSLDSQEEDLDFEDDDADALLTVAKPQQKTIVPFDFEDDGFSFSNDDEEGKLSTDIAGISFPSSHANTDVEQLFVSDSISNPGVTALMVAKSLAKQQKLPVHVLEAKWLYIFHKGVLPKLLGTIFVCLQWWSTQYLDHHFRYDLFVGAVYAATAYTIINKFVLQPRVIKPWLLARAEPSLDVKNESKTMGMRVFENTKIEWFFDPLA